MFVGSMAKGIMIFNSQDVNGNLVPTSIMSLELLSCLHNHLDVIFPSLNAFFVLKQFTGGMQYLMTF